jgi:hypothetical protein
MTKNNFRENQGDTGKHIFWWKFFEKMTPLKSEIL